MDILDELEAFEDRNGEDKISLTPEEQLEFLQSLRNHKGMWILAKIMQAQVDSLMLGIINAPADGISGVLAQEYHKGQLEGRQAWSVLLDTEIATLQYGINAAKTDMNEEQGNE